MWQVENFTPFATERSWVRDRDGAEVWLVAVRCTFRINPDGSTAVADEQAPPVLAPVYRGDPATTSLLYDSDFYLTKPTTDLLLHGHAYAPGGKPTTAVDVTMQVGDVRKTLRVTGDRHSQEAFSGGSSGLTQPFTQMPLTYERAFGGSEAKPPRDANRPRFDDRNPVGTGYASAERQTAPNIHYPGVSLGSRPAGFGPVCSHWQPRAQLRRYLRREVEDRTASALSARPGRPVLPLLAGGPAAEGVPPGR